MSVERHEVGPRMSQVVIHGNTVYLAGVVARNASGKSMTEQTQDVLATIDGYLAKAGTDKSKLLSANIWITDMAKFNEMNAVWDAWVSPGNTPARATVEAKLAAPGYNVEIMVVAAKRPHGAARRSRRTQGAAARDRRSALRRCGPVWDQATYMPKGGAAARGRQAARLSRLAHERRIPRASASCSTRSRATARACRRLRRCQPHPRRAPRVREGHQGAGGLCRALRARTGSASYDAWTRARPANDFAAMRAVSGEDAGAEPRVRRLLPPYATSPTR